MHWQCCNFACALLGLLVGGFNIFRPVHLNTVLSFETFLLGHLGVSNRTGGFPGSVWGSMARVRVQECVREKAVLSQIPGFPKALGGMTA